MIPGPASRWRLLAARTLLLTAVLPTPGGAQQAAAQRRPAAVAQFRRMPDLRDSTLAVAGRLLIPFKAVPSVTWRDTSDASLDQRVAQQSPPPNAPLTRFPLDVQLTVYRYVTAPVLSVPHVVGRPLPLAVRLIRRSRLAPADRGTEYSDAIPAGAVTRQHPDSGTAAKAGDSVEVWVSMGAHPVEPTLQMPLLVGRTLDEAKALLSPLGLQLTHADSVEDAANAGRIVAQSPGEGGVVHASDAVVVRVAVAPPPVVDTLPPGIDTVSRRVTVPSLVSLGLDSARALLRATGLTLGPPQVLGTLLDSVVATQVPEPGTLVTRGASVIVTLRVQPPERSWWLVLFGIAVGAAMAYAVSRWMRHPRSVTAAHVHLEPSTAPDARIERPPAESLVSVSVTVADRPPVITLDHAGALVAGEEVAHERRR